MCDKINDFVLVVSVNNLIFIFGVFVVIGVIILVVVIIEIVVDLVVIWISVVIFYFNNIGEICDFFVIFVIVVLILEFNNILLNVLFVLIINNMFVIGLR